MEQDANNTPSVDQPPAATDHTPQCTDQKRDFEQAFSHPSPDRDAKRLRPISPSHHTVSAPANDSAFDNNGVNDGNSNATYSLGSIPETVEAQPVYEMRQDDPILPIDPCLLESSRNEICKHLDIIKRNTSNGQFDVVTIKSLLEELMSNMTCDTPLDIALTRALGVLSSDNASTSPMEPVLDQTASPRTISSLSEMDTPSPPSPPIDISRLTAAVSSTTAGIELQDKSTQTEPEPISTHNHTLDDPVAHHRDFSDTELWERELEAIRRLQPFVKGTYKKVNLPLREAGFEASTSYDLKNIQDLTPSSKEAPRRSKRIGTATKRNEYEHHEIISLADTDEEDHGGPKQNSHLVGGGDLVYCENGYRLIPSAGEEEEEEEEEDDEESPRSEHSLYEDSSNEKRCNIDDLPDYEESEIDENTRQQDIRYSIHSTVSMGRYDGNDTGDDDYDSVDYDHNYALENDGMIGAYKAEDRGRTTYGHTTTSQRRLDAGRERSRSPEARYSERLPHREERHYSRRYTSNGLLDSARREKPYDARHIDARNDLSAQTGREKSYDNAKQRYIRDKPQNTLFYYAQDTNLASKSEQALRYQDRLSDVGEIPGPRSGLRLKLDDYISAIGSDAMGLERAIQRAIQESFYASETLDEEQALQEIWANQTTKLFKGFPLVEEIGFVTVENIQKPEGDCYWRALGYILHGKAARWDMIKADHLVYLHHVLSDRTHPRYQLYTKLNLTFFETRGGGLRNTGTPMYKANIWQLLHLPHSWTPGVMQQITADLYNIHLVTFTYDQRKNMCSEEFRYPRVSVAATAHFLNAPKAGSQKVKHVTQHPWRNDYTNEVPPPVPRSHGCDLFELSKLMSAAGNASGPTLQ
ncbi:hypothetical protein F4678DRAFT_486064 [Xylaria arbuscula]|nr:hypothetical protein F4678DRAFT_486064 [Xylaria arbuscula]